MSTAPLPAQLAGSTFTERTLAAAAVPRTDKLPPPACEVSLRRQLEDAQCEFAAKPTSVDALIWVGRRTEFLGRYAEAIAPLLVGVDEVGRGHLQQLEHRRAAPDRDRAHT